MNAFIFFALRSLSLSHTHTQTIGINRKSVDTNKRIEDRDIKFLLAQSKSNRMLLLLFSAEYDQQLRFYPMSRVRLGEFYTAMG